jgi:CMP-N,N'-diacetyllegionaminic acid synthase
MKHTFLAIIPARGGSIGIPRKNLRLLNGKPLIAWTIEAALNTVGLDRVVVSTEDEEIAEISKLYGAEVPFMRPTNLARDNTPTLEVLQHILYQFDRDESYSPDAVVTLQPTSPLRTNKHIEEALCLFEADIRADCLVSCIKVPHNFHPESVMTLQKNGYLKPYSDKKVLPSRRQDKTEIYARNGAAIYITRASNLDRFIIGGNTIPFLMNNHESVDIDTEEDLLRAEYLLRNINSD